MMGDPQSPISIPGPAMGVCGPDGAIPKCIFASEGVISAVRDLIKAIDAKQLVETELALAPQDMRANLATTALEKNEAAIERYRRCLFEMRKDSGFPDSTAEYYVVVFTAPEVPLPTTYMKPIRTNDKI
jgi:hypothetical protein